ncbi:MAG TPA: DMT family transporter [Spirochaetota bacterium]|nr:DMT family transporter [Spirochaetota bacterium]
MKKEIIPAVTACFLWSTAFVFAKTALRYNTPFMTAGQRFMLAGIILLPFSGSPLAFLKYIKKNLIFIMLISLFQTVLLYGIFFTALKVVGGAQAAIVIGSAPLVSAVISHFMQHNDKLSPAKFISLLTGLCGIVLISITTKPWQAGGMIQFCGIMALLLGTVFSAMGNVLGAKYKSRVKPRQLTCCQIFTGGVILFLIGMLYEEGPLLITAGRYYISLLWLSFISAAGFTIWYSLLKKVKVSRLNLWKFIIPVNGAVLSWCFLSKESPSLTGITGMVFTALAIFLFYFFDRE